MKEDRFHLRSETEIILDDIIEAADPEILTGNCTKFGAVTLDSRSVKKGDLFFALKGESSDGHKYIENAVSSGAGGVIIEYFPERTELSKFQNISILKVKNTLETLHSLAKKKLGKYRLKNIKISGSIGKTTARKMAVSIFELIVSGTSHFRSKRARRIPRRRSRCARRHRRHMRECRLRRRRRGTLSVDGASVNARATAAKAGSLDTSLVVNRERAGRQPQSLLIRPG